MTRFLACLGLTLALVFALPQSVQAQEEEPESEVAPAEEELGELEGIEDFEEEEDFDSIEDILEGDEEVLGGQGYSYDPGDRRDPFRSLLTIPERQQIVGPRPEGIPGLLIDEVEVTGIYVTSKGPVAQVQAANKPKSFLLRPGDQLYDGDVVRISYARGSLAEVVFKQVINDPTAAKPFREVVKKLTP